MSLTLNQVILLMPLTAQVADKSSYLHTTLQREREALICIATPNTVDVSLFILCLFVSLPFTCIIVHNIVSFMSLHISFLCFSNRRAYPKTEPNHCPLYIEVSFFL